MNFQDVENEIWEKTKNIEGWNSEEKCATLVATILAFKPKVCVELGVFSGRSLCAIGLTLQKAGGGKIVGIDSWSSTDNVAGHDQADAKQWWGPEGDCGKVLHVRKAEAYGWVESLGIKDFVELREKHVADAAADFDEESLDFLHMDAGKSFVDSMKHNALWLPKVKRGGIIVYDDIDWRTTRAAYMRLRQHTRVLYEIFFRGEQAFAVLQRE